MIENKQIKTQVKLLQEMLRIRMIEEKIAEKYSEQKMRCPVHLSIGQEAVAVGVCNALSNCDYILSTHRAHAHYLAKGGSLKAMMAEIYGKQTGCSLGRGGSMHLVDLDVGMLGSTPIVGGSLPVALGVAFAMKLKNSEATTAVFFGEGSTEEGVFGESLNFAALEKLPILFVCENNFYSVYSPLEVRQSKERDRLKIALAHGIEAFHANGNDVEEVLKVTQKALSKIKEGSGPIYLEFTTYRFREHCGPNFDNDIGYRTEDEYERYKQTCPITTYLQSLMKHALIQESDLDKMRQEINQEIDKAFLFAESSPYPIFESDEESVYAKKTD
jgi:TPP-dependent pyruvate/acetoin dehydrogenase alpha subunit